MKKILVAEDDQFLSEAYLLALRKAGFAPFPAHDGNEALVWLTDNQADLMILDLVMPNKGGMETLKSIREHGNLKDLPIWVISNIDRPEIRQEALDAGANDYIIKSNISIKDLVDQVSRALGNGKK